MHDIGEGTIRRIDWTELTPIVLLLRVFNVSLGIRILFISLVGLWLTVLSMVLMGIPQNLTHPEWDIRLNLPFDILFGGAASFRENSMPVLYPVLWVVSVALIWIFCGGIICRIVAVRLTVDESETTRSLFLFFQKRGIGYFSSIIILSLGIICCFLPVLFTGWIMTVPILNYIAAVLFPIPLLFVFFTIFLSLGLAVGWMMLFAAVSVDGSDGFDAISRMFSYVYQRPLHYIVYWAFCGVLGYLGFLLVMLFTYSAVVICSQVFAAVIEDESAPVIMFWLNVVWSIQVAYMLAWFWTSSVAIYLLLRRSVDATPMNEVYRATSPKIRTLPAVKLDKQGGRKPAG